MNGKKIVLVATLTGALMGLAAPAAWAQGPATGETLGTGVGYRRGASAVVTGGMVAGDTVAGWQGGGLGLNAVTLGELDQAEIDGLVFMREEEKLAHDVYTVLYAQWGLAEFSNIAESEQRHTESVLNLLNRYGIDDPTVGLGAGEFRDAELQALYDELVAWGGESVEAALRVGATIEEVDILDIEERIAQTDEAAIQRAYTNLLRGSRNHLRAFVAALEAQAGVIYSPEYLPAEAYEATVSGDTETGTGRGDGQAQRASDACDEECDTSGNDATQLRGGRP